MAQTCTWCFASLDSLESTVLSLSGVWQWVGQKKDIMTPKLQFPASTRRAKPRYHLCSSTSNRFCVSINPIVVIFVSLPLACGRTPGPRGLGVALKFMVCEFVSYIALQQGSDTPNFQTITVPKGIFQESCSSNLFGLQLFGSSSAAEPGGRLRRLISRESRKPIDRSVSCSLYQKTIWTPLHPG